jgi:nucleoside-diphosphate-sugar epimerase
MKILVTGATGLIGCHSVSALLDAGHLVRVFVRDASKLDHVLGPFGRSAKDVEVSTGELADRDAFRQALEGCGGFLHCAGIFSPDRGDEALLVATNVEGTRAVLEVASELDVECGLYVSSMLALFPPGGSVMTADDAVAEPSSMYAKTKADAERIARSFQEDTSLPLTILYPAAVQGPADPTFSIGPQIIANALAKAEVLVTEGGLATTDVRDLATVVAAIFDGRSEHRRLMAPSFFVSHDRYHGLLESLTGRTLRAQRMPGWLLRIMGRLGDVAQRLGRSVQLTYEASEVLTRSVPVDDAEACRILGREPINDEQSFRDLIAWMVDAGRLAPEDAGTVGVAQATHAKSMKLGAKNE